MSGCLIKLTSGKNLTPFIDKKSATEKELESESDLECSLCKDI